MEVVDPLETYLESAKGKRHFKYRHNQLDQSDAETTIETLISGSEEDLVGYENDVAEFIKQEDTLLENELMKPMTSESECDDTKICENFIFVNLLKDYKILFEKNCTPHAKNEKGIALESLAADYRAKTKVNMNRKQILKKFNNIKTRIKGALDKNRTGSTKKSLKGWEKAFLELWSEVDKNPVLCSIPAAITVRVIPAESSEDSSMCHNNINAKQTQSKDYQNSLTIKELKKMVLIAQLRAAQSQEKAAIAQEKAALAKERAAIAKEKAAIAKEMAAIASQEASIAQQKAAIMQKRYVTKDI